MAGKVVKSGPMRFRIALQSASENPSAHGDPGKTWATDATRWCSIEPMKGREFVGGAQTDSRVTHKVRIRAGDSVVDALTPHDRLLFGTRIFNIIEVINPRELDKMRIILCEEKTSP